MSIFVVYTLLLRIKRPSTWRLSMLPKVICSILFVKRRTWVKIQHFISSFRYAPVFTTCTSRVLSIEISNQKIFSSRMEISSKSVISVGVYNLIICSKEILFAELLSTWPLKWSKTKITTIHLIYGLWVFFSTSWSTEELHSQVFIQERSVTRSWEVKLDLSQVFQMSIRI